MSYTQTVIEAIFSTSVNLFWLKFRNCMDKNSLGVEVTDEPKWTKWLYKVICFWGTISTVQKNKNPKGPSGMFFTGGCRRADWLLPLIQRASWQKPVSNLGDTLVYFTIRALIGNRGKLQGYWREAPSETGFTLFLLLNSPILPKASHQKKVLINPCLPNSMNDIMGEIADTCENNCIFSSEIIFQ